MYAYIQYICISYIQYTRLCVLCARCIHNMCLRTKTHLLPNKKRYENKMHAKPPKTNVEGKRLRGVSIVLTQKDNTKIN